MALRNGFALAVLGALALVILAPVLLRPGREPLPAQHESLVIITPHNEATRSEFTRAFTQWYRERTGRAVVIDWRTPGGASEIARYLASEMLAAFRLHWERDLGQRWSAEVEGAFDNPSVAPGEETVAARARKAFLASGVSCGVDLFFGGGSFDHIRQAAAGRLVDSGVVAAHPEWFGPLIPQSLGGEPYWDPQGRWIGVALAAFGICINHDALARLGMEETPRRWSDLADPRLLGSVALSDPTQSGSAAKAFEMLIQQQMAEAVAEGQTPEEGWAGGMRLLRRVAANARYFTDSASKVPWDVESGDAAAGMAIDFYGRFQSEAVRRPDGTSRMEYRTPEGGSSFGADPIAMLRGAPSPEAARAFIEFTISPEGQKLWNWKVGTPGGPSRYALRRLPILPTLYAPEFAPLRSDPGVNPYGEAGLDYRPQWTGPLFRSIGFIVQTMCIDSHEELREAWRALVAAGFPPEATARFDDVSALAYPIVMNELRPALSTGQKIGQVRLAREWGERFRSAYREVTALARAGR